MSRLSSRWESNPHAQEHWFLKPTSLPFLHLRLFSFSHDFLRIGLIGFTPVDLFTATRFIVFIGLHQVPFLCGVLLLDAHRLYQHHRVRLPTNSSNLFWGDCLVGFYASF